MPKSKKKRKGRKGKRKGKKGKKKKQEVPQPPPLHDLTKLYNDFIESVEEFKRSRNKARKKRIEAWYMTREMMNLHHDNDVYHKYLKDKMDEIENLMKELTDQLNQEREAIEKIIAKRLEEMDKIIAGYKARSAKAESQLAELRTKLQEFEPLMRELAGLMSKLKELQALIPVYELEANIKTRHLKNQYLYERSKLHNHLESELFKLIQTCRTFLMPILSDHMSSMELENRCNRWDLGRLDLENFRLYREREKLLEKRSWLNIEREYLSIDWAFSKMTQMDARKKVQRKEEKIFKAKKKGAESEDECELAVAFKAYLTKKLEHIERAKQRELRAKARREARQKKLHHEAEKKKRAEILEAKRAKAKAAKLGLITDSEEEDTEEEMEDEWGELEYYEDDEGNWVIATPSRMAQHKAILENRALSELETQVEDIKQMISKEGEESETTGSASEGSAGSGTDVDDEDPGKKEKSASGGDFDDDFVDDDDDDDDFGFDDDITD